MDQKFAFRHLTKRVALDKDTVTYRLLSRELGITVKDAKSYLEAYLSDPQAIERGVSPTWVLSGTLEPSRAKGTTNGDAMDVDGEEDKVQAAEEQVNRRTIMLVASADLEATLARFRGTPSKHVYALSPIAPPTLSSLASYALTSISDGAQSKWKPAPEGGYGGIVHPDGERKKKGKGKAKAAPVTAPARTASSSSVGTSAPKPAAAAKSASSTSTKGKATASTSSKASTSAAKPAARPIGQLGGLFAKMAAKSSSDNKKKVPAKRKASPPPRAKTVTKAVPAPSTTTKSKAAPPKKAGRSNGIFGDEELASDEDFDMAGDDEDFDEEAMREAELEAQRKVAAKGKAKASSTSASTSRSTTPVVKKEDSGLSAKERKAKEKKDLDNLFSDDDDMQIEPAAPSKPAPKKPGPTAAEKRAIATANMKQSNIGSMFAKK